MRRLAAGGAIVLTSTGRLRADGTTDGHPLQRVAGLTVAGFDDPLEWHGADPGDPRRVFSFAERPDGAAEEAAAEARIVTWFDALPDRPDVVMVHENGLAQHLAQTIAARHDTEPLTILTGHDHRQHVDRRGSAVVVDAGTVGASGIYGVGKDTVGIGRLHFGRHGALEGVDLVSIEPVSGMAQAQRLVLDRARCPGDRDSCTLSAGEAAAAAPPARG
jgi:hypothetical protein